MTNSDAKKFFDSAGGPPVPVELAEMARGMNMSELRMFALKIATEHLGKLSLLYKRAVKRCAYCVMVSDTAGADTSCDHCKAEAELLSYMEAEALCLGKFMLAAHEPHTRLSAEKEAAAEKAPKS